MADPKFDQYVNNQHLFQTPLFKKYCTAWGQWRELERLIDLYSHHGSNAIFETYLSGVEKLAVRRLIEWRCTLAEKETIRRQIDYHIELRLRYARSASERQKAMERGEEIALLEAFGIEYRREYAVAHERADRAWEQSDFLYQHQFLAVDLGFVETDDYDRRR